MSELTDDEAIIMALLLGCTFYKNQTDYWFAGDDAVDPDLLPFEEVRFIEIRDARERGETQAPNWGWASKADLARDFIKWSLANKDKP